MQQHIEQGITCALLGDESAIPRLEDYFKCAGLMIWCRTEAAAAAAEAAAWMNAAEVF